MEMEYISSIENGLTTASVTICHSESEWEWWESVAKKLNPLLSSPFEEDEGIVWIDRTTHRATSLGVEEAIILFASIVNHLLTAPGSSQVTLEILIERR